MNKFGLIFRHYFSRLIKDKLGLAIQVGLPLFIILFMINLDDDTPYLGQMWARLASNFIIGFSLFGGQWALGHIFDDLKETRKWRLMATPIDTGVFTKAAILGSMVISFINSMIIVIVVTIVTPVEWSNLPLLIGTLILTNLLSHAFNYFITIVVKEYKTANAITMVVSMGLLIAGGGVIMGIQNLVNLDAFTFIHDYATPLSIGRQMITYGGGAMTFETGEFVHVAADWGMVLFNAGLLLGVTALFVVASFVARKVKES